MGCQLREGARSPVPSWRTPPADFEPGRNLPDHGTLIIGTKATVFANLSYQSVRIIPEPRMQELAPTLPAKTLPRAPNATIRGIARGVS
jgi:hypothetical protein